MNGFELAGRAMKVGHVTDRTDGQLGGIAGQGGKTLQWVFLWVSVMNINWYISVPELSSKVVLKF